mmetsp:Transcript_40586/g.39147  ORF Transcript_40586/g.39147 Transcript_40586/m.39147 type:complete len:219 (+) Transcript_40586:445-1101(+)
MGNYHVVDLFRPKNHTIVLKDLPQASINDIQTNGVRIYQFCGTIKNEIESMIGTAVLFLGGMSAKEERFSRIRNSHVPEYMEFANLQFLKEALDIELERREIEDVYLEEELIAEGDLFLIMRLDGIDPIVMFGTGSVASHCVVAIRFDHELYMVEVQDALFWPTKGIQRTPYDQWLKQAKAADYNVIHLPLSEASKAKWNSKAAKKFFRDHEGLAYGF